MRGDTRSFDRGLLKLLLLLAIAGAIFAIVSRGLGQRLLALYHQEQGAYLLSRALAVEGRESQTGIWLEPEPLAKPEAQALARRALERLQTAITLDPLDFQLHRWLGRAALLLDQPETAIAAFSEAVRLRPSNPLVWWELGIAYERLAPSTTSHHRDDELSLPLEFTRKAAGRGSMLLDSPVPASLEAEKSSGWGLVWDQSLNQESWSLPDAPAGNGWWVPRDAITRTVFYASVPITIAFRLSLPVTHTVLLFWIGVTPVQGRDVVTYTVWVDEQKVFSQSLQGEEKHSGWYPAQVDLSAWAGRTISLKLALDTSATGRVRGGWASPQLVSADTARCHMSSCWFRSAAAWREGGFTAQSLVREGEIARGRRQYDKALLWYKRASALGLDMESSYWYVVFQSTQDWRALEKSISADRGWVSNDMRARAWLRWGAYLHEQDRDKEAEVVLRQAIATTPSSSTFYPVLSEMYRFLGLSQWSQRKMAEAVQSMRQAVKLNERNTWAHIHYGKVLYLSDPTLAYQTEQEFAIALGQDPSASIWRNLIEFWRWVREADRAAKLCDQAKEKGIQAELDNICSE